MKDQSKRHQHLRRALILSAAVAALTATFQSARATTMVEDWGQGELGDGAADNSSIPVAVSGLSSGVTAISAGVNHSLAVQNSNIMAWGSNTYYQLGVGYSTQFIFVPVTVNYISGGITAVAGGGAHSLALQNGSVYAWGNNYYDQLGTLTLYNDNDPIPTAVSGLTSGVTAIACGDSHSLAIQNGGAYAWGYNSEGQLGNGLTTNTYNPMAVIGLTSGVTAIAGTACSSPQSDVTKFSQQLNKLRGTNAE